MHACTCEPKSNTRHSCTTKGKAGWANALHSGVGRAKLFGLARSSITELRPLRDLLSSLRMPSSEPIEKQIHPNKGKVCWTLGTWLPGPIVAHTTLSPCYRGIGCTLLLPSPEDFPQRISIFVKDDYLRCESETIRATLQST